MIFTFIKAQTLRNVINRIPTFLYRNEHTKTSAVGQQESTTAKSELQTFDENPYKRAKRVCILCKYNIEPDYKNVRMLSQFQSRHTGRIYKKHITGLCQYKQTRVEQEIAKAQAAGLMAYMTKEIKYVRDPPLFDPNFPFKPNPY